MMHVTKQPLPSQTVLTPRGSRPRSKIQAPVPQIPISRWESQAIKMASQPSNQSESGLKTVPKQKSLESLTLQHCRSKALAIRRPQ